jgi:hypothetical protein
MTYTCTRDADSWQLYSTMKGVKAVAADLSGTLTVIVRKALAKLNENPDLSEEKLARRAYNEMYSHMERVDGFGACDTEPRGVLAHEIEKAFRLDPYTLD